MKILIVGGGPAGLAFGALMSGDGHSITILERNRPEVSPGWGITLRNHALGFLGLDQRIETEALDGRAFWRGGQLVVDLPNPPQGHLVTCPRAALTSALTEICAGEGLSVTHDRNAQEPSAADLDSCDLVVAADGVNSSIRRRYADVFKPTTSEGENRFTWLGCAARFDKLTILLADGDPPLLAWAYKYTDERSTFIVECTEQTFERLGFAERGVDGTRATIEAAFDAVLKGRDVLSESTIPWLHFPVLSCERLTHRNVVLLGDAAHTTHFSQGFGTMFAFDDALSLATSIKEAPSLTEALSRYEATQIEKIAEFQATAGNSMKWSERLLVGAEAKDEAQVQELIEARWPNNQVTSSPLGPGAERPAVPPDLDRLSGTSPRS